MDDVEGGGLADVGGVGLGGHAQDEDLSPLERLALVVEGVLDLADPVGGHGRIDLVGKLDKARGVYLRVLSFQAR